MARNPQMPEDYKDSMGATLGPCPLTKLCVRPCLGCFPQGKGTLF